MPMRRSLQTHTSRCVHGRRTFHLDRDEVMLLKSIRTAMLLCDMSCDMWRGTWSGTWSDMRLLQGSVDRTVPAIQTSIVTSVTLVTCWYNYTFISDIQVRSRVVAYLQVRQSMSDPRTVVRLMLGRVSAWKEYQPGQSGPFV